MWRAGCLLVASLTALASDARADGDAPPDAKADARDAFGFKKRPTTTAPPLDCSDGTEFGCTGATDPLADTASPYGLAQWLPASYLLRLPVGSASHDAVAGYALGASRDGAGVSFGGATGLENRWTVEGAPADGLNIGGADTRIPLAFLDGILVTAGGFTARDRTSTGGTIDARLRGGTPTHVVEVRAWAGITSPARQRPVAPFTFVPRRGQLDAGPEGAVHAVATGPLGALLGGQAWYAAGLGVELESLEITWRSGITRDRDQDGTIDGLPGVVPVDRVDKYTRRPMLLRVPVMLRAGLDRGVHHVDVSVVGAVETSSFYLYNSTLQASGTDDVAVIGDAMATWRGTWKQTRARAQLAWHRSMHRESASDSAAANVPQLLSAYVPADLAEDPRLSAACVDNVATDLYPLVTNCPVPTGWFASGGAGLLQDRTGDRPSLTADIAHRVGNNVVRAGATAEDTRYVVSSRFTGGSQVFSLFPDHRAERRFVDRDAICNIELALPCPTVDESVVSYRTRYTAAHIEDTWHPTPTLAVDGGLRWELMWVGTKLHFSDQLAPRLGASWDPIGGGRSRLWVSMGRSYALLPAGLGRTITERDRTVDLVTSSFGEGRAVDTGAVISVAGDVEPIAQDEVTTGAQVALARTVRATVWVQGRWLRRGLDTTSTGFDNPGRFGGTPASRETGLIAAELATSPTAALTLRAGYMYGRTIGTWTGAYDPREGATLYAGSDYDATSVNLLGRLPTDIGHRTYVEAERRGHLATLPVALSLRLTTGSGRPRSALADADTGLIHLIPRGSAGRSPMLTQANVRMSARWQGLDVTLDVFNLFNRREATTIEEVYATGMVAPIDGGTTQDLLWLKTESGSEAPRRATYAHATGYQSPLSAVLGVRRNF